MRRFGIALLLAAFGFLPGCALVCDRVQDSCAETCMSRADAGLSLSACLDRCRGGAWCS